jgi:hypothetical protein
MHPSLTEKETLAARGLFALVDQRFQSKQAESNVQAHNHKATLPLGNPYLRPVEPVKQDKLIRRQGNCIILINI